MNDLTKLVTFLKNWWKAIQEHTYSVSVDNFPEYPEFPEIPETIVPEFPLEEVRDVLLQVKSEISKQGSDICKDIKKVKQDKLDLSPIIKKLELLNGNKELVNEIRRIVDSINGININIDLSPLLESIGTIIEKLSVESVEKEPDFSEIIKVIREINIPNFPKTIVVDGVAKEDTLQKLVGFNIPAFDYISLAYVPSGNGVGEIATVVYKTGGSSGIIVATLTIAYNASNEISSITKT